MKLFTIGHSNHSIEVFITLLKKHSITALADVRSHPYSRYLPHFNQATLKASLLESGINYVFLGQELGARPNDTNCYVDGKALYEKIASTPKFTDGIQRLLKGAKNYTIALMCAEQDPIHCHRAILICQNLQKFNLDIYHILKNSDIETHQSLEERLLDLHGLNQPKLPQAIQLSIFDEIVLTESSTTQYSREKSLIEAYKRQGDRNAYVETEGKHE